MQNKLVNTVHLTRKSVNTFTLIACITAMGFASVPAYAINGQSDTFTTIVQNNLLKNEKGAERIYVKLSETAKNACMIIGSRSLSDRRQSKACTSDLLNDFIVDLNDSRVTAFHERVLAE